VIINGNYFDESDGNLMERGRAKGLSTALFIAKSARRFVNELVPSFTFENTIDIIDYEQNKTVWGYGADRPSAVDVVDEALAWIDGRTSERFFAWLFHFDVHNWRQLNDDYVETMARQAGIDEPDLRKRAYRGAAAGVDLALARFLKGLKDRQLDERTIIMFVSDHGEALGQQGHWQHAVFLWESLVHVPLLLYVPGVAPARIQSPVGLVDIAPTVARFFDAHADVASYHGHDLLRHALPGAHDDGLPLLMQSMRKDEVLRVGIIERRPPYHKLILPLDSAEPELCDLAATDPDNANVARERHRLMLEMLSKLVRSPVFPRGDEETEPSEGERTAAR
ncbi:MAG TPA: sulfatase-like hydrolase/transferase, partial [Polyangiaceae bacterium]|nr:sulfatase-like hydrolase/transferase [Polyangiaceae bacterium]